MSDEDFATAATIQTPIGLWSAWFVNAAGMQADWARFVAARGVKDARAFARLATCASPLEFACAQAGFAQETLADWLELQRRLFGEFDPERADSALAVA
ncbi:MAG TPA: hypothetical protein VFS55_10175 [Dokdonella sp.]|nr:hypothetical protein [Dokdonella sp.]